LRRCGVGKSNRSSDEQQPRSLQNETEASLLNATTDQGTASPHSKRRDADDFAAKMTTRKVDQQHDGLSQDNPSSSDADELLQHDNKTNFTCASRARAAVGYLRDLVLREPA
jgi:hypothetical protein